MQKIAKITLLVLLCAGGLHAQKYRKQVAEGNKKYQSENYDEAELSYRRAINHRADEAAVAEYNLGNALLKQKRYEDGRSALERSLAQSEDPSLQAKTWHNIGNSFFEEEKLKEAVEAYKKSLLQNPGDDETRYNLARTMQKMKQQEQEQKQNQDQDQKKDQDQEKSKDQEKDQDQDQDQDQKDNESGDSEKEDSDKQQDQSDPSKNGEQDQDQQAKEMPDPKEISREDAERLLKALSEDEEKLQQKLLEKKIKKEPNKGRKDW